MCLLEFNSSSFEKCIESWNQYKNYRKVLSSPQIVPLSLITNPSGKCQPKTSTNLFSVTYAFCLYRMSYKRNEIVCRLHESIRYVFWKHLSPSVACLFIPLQSLLKRRIYLNEFHCIIFFFSIKHSLVLYLRNPCMVIVFSYWSFIVWGFIFRSITSFDLIFIHGPNYGQNLSFANGWPADLVPFVKKTTLSPLTCLWQKSNDHTYVGVFLESKICSFHFCLSFTKTIQSWLLWFYGLKSDKMSSPSLFCFTELCW